MEVLTGRPRVRAIGEKNYGGMLDTRTLQFVGPSAAPVVWYASAPQAALLTSEGDTPKTLVYGAMGSGKTRGVLAPWLLLRALQFTGHYVEGGATAPTEKRLALIARALRDCMPSGWYTYRAHDGLFMLRNGVNLRLAATKQYSEALGSPVQGWDWAFHAGDEWQDQLNAHDDVLARGRRAPGGRYRQLCTATAKDSPAWRTARDGMLTSRMWSIARLEGRSNVFVAQQWWDDKKHEWDDRKYRRLVLAQDVGPERMVYTSWSRERNLIHIPDIGAKDITSEILRGVTGDPNSALGAGHDPGQIQDVTELVRAYRFRGQREHVWVVVGEHVTKASTSQEHATSLLKLIQERWDYNLYAPRIGRNAPLKMDPYCPKIHIRIDPYGDNDSRPDKSVRLQFEKLGMHARSAEYKGGKGNGRIPKEAGIEMVNRLLRSADGTTRLYVACDERRVPCAPKLVEAFEMSERDTDGKAETKVKHREDLSHYPASVRYFLWRFEHLKSSAPAWRANG